jgi:hypothetical protein
VTVRDHDHLRALDFRFSWLRSDGGKYIRAL